MSMPDRPTPVTRPDRFGPFATSHPGRRRKSFQDQLAIRIGPGLHCLKVPGAWHTPSHQTGAPGRSLTRAAAGLPGKKGSAAGTTPPGSRSWAQRMPTDSRASFWAGVGWAGQYR